MQATRVSTMAGEPLPQVFEDLFEAHSLLVYRTASGVTGRVEDASGAILQSCRDLMEPTTRLSVTRPLSPSM